MSEYERRQQRQAPTNLPVLKPLQRRQEHPSFAPLPKPREGSSAPQLLILQDARSPVIAQRRAALPTLKAAELSREDSLAVQRRTQRLTLQRQALHDSGDVLNRRDLTPEPQHLLSRNAPPTTAAAPALTPTDLQERTKALGQESLAVLKRDAGYLPFHKRAELACHALEAGRRQGIEVESLRQQLLSEVKDPMQRETLQGIFLRQDTGRLIAAQAREEHGLLLRHVQLQRAVGEAQQEHDQLSQSTALERVQARRGQGQPLPEDVRQQLEVGLNHDLSVVRIHNDDEADQIARSLHAVAFTSGKDIYFQAREYNTADKLELLAHEVTHVKQQDQGKVSPGIDPDASLESEAQQFGEEFVLGGSSGVSPKVRHSSKKAAGGPASEAAPQVAVQRLADPTPPAGFWFGGKWTHQFTGTLGESHITMTLTRTGNQVSGTYQYQGQTGSLSLTGKISTLSNMATLTELDVKAPNGTLGTAQLILTADNDTSVRGSWVSAGKDLPILVTLADTAKQPTPQPVPKNTEPKNTDTASINPPPSYVPLLPAGQKGTDLTEKSLASLRTSIAAQLVQWKIEVPPAGSKQSVMTLSAQGLADIKSYEGEGRNVYNDSAGLPTIGFGHLLDRNRDHEVSSKEWVAYDALGYPRRDLTEEQEQGLLVKDVTPYVDAMNEALSVPVTQGMFDAFVCFLFNTGSPTAAAFLRTNIADAVNAGKYAEVPAAMYKWIHVTINKKLVVQKGLQNRRLKEITQFATPYVAPK